MSDTATETEPTTTEAAPVEKAPKNQPHPCLCSTFLLRDAQDAETEFTTECKSETSRVFAQGHDARLISFLVSGHFDGYTIMQEQESGGRLTFTDPGHAAANISDALGAKADKAVANAQARVDVKTERDAAKAAKKAATEKEKADKAAAKEAAKVAKAAAPKDVPVKVVSESVVDDGPITPAVGDKLVIKVGKGEYEADVEAGTGELEGKLAVRFLNMRGEEEVRDIELVRVLRRG